MEKKGPISEPDYKKLYHDLFHEFNCLKAEFCAISEMVFKLRMEMQNVSIEELQDEAGDSTEQYMDTIMSQDEYGIYSEYWKVMLNGWLGDIPGIDL